MITRRGLFRSLLAGSAIAGVAIAKPTMDLQPTGIVFQKSTEWPTIQLSTLLEISGNGWNQNPQLEQERQQKEQEDKTAPVHDKKHMQMPQEAAEQEAQQPGHDARWDRVMVSL